MAIAALLSVASIVGIAHMVTKGVTPVPVVSQRLGHNKIEITLNVYAHALPSMGRDAAAALSVSERLRRQPRRSH